MTKGAYRTSGRAGDERGARTDRQIRRMEASILRRVTEVQTAADAAQAAADAAASAATGPRLLSVVGLLDHSNTSARGVLFTYTLAANTLAAERGLRFMLDAEVLQNNGSRTLTLDVTFGGSAIWQDELTSMAASATLKPAQVEFRIWAESSANQHMNGRVKLMTADPATTGFGELVAGNNLQLDSLIASDDIAVDLTAEQTLEFGVTWSAAHTDIRFTRRGAVLELL